MSVHNAEKYLKETISSILNQTFTDFELIIVNDLSTDSSLEIINSFQDPRIKVINNKENIGLTKSLNLAIEESKGEYIARMDADDICFPNRFKSQVAFLDKNKEIALCGGEAEIIDKNNNITGDIMVEYTPGYVRSSLFFRNVFIHPSIMFRKKDIIEIGLYDESYRYAQDYELYLRLIAKGKLLSNIKEKILKYRIHDEGISVAKLDTQNSFFVTAMQKGYEQVLNIKTSKEVFIGLRNVIMHNKIPSFFTQIILINLCFSIRKDYRRIFPADTEGSIKVTQYTQMIFNRIINGNIFKKFLIKLMAMAFKLKI